MFDGSNVYVASHRSSVSRWTVALAAPTAALDGPTRRLIFIAGASGGALLGVGVACAFAWGTGADWGS